MSQQRDTDRAIRNLMNWSDRPEWVQAKSTVIAAHLAPVCEHFGRSQDELVQELAEHGYGGMLFGVMFEDLVSRGLPPDGRNLIDDYLQRRDWRESAPGRRYLQQLRDSALSLYEVIAVSPGRHCDLRDLVRGGEPVRVHEHLGTQNLVRWDRIAARVLKSDGRHIFSGGILPFTQEESQELLQALNSTRKKRMRKRGRRADQETAAQSLPPEVLDRQLLQEACPAFTQIWLRHTLEKLHAPLPDLVNRDGESLVFTESRFPFDERNRKAIIERLEAAAEWERDPAGEPVWTWLAKDPRPGKPPAQGLLLQSFYNGERPVSGTLELKPGALTLTTNSLERTERGKEALMALLHGLIGQPLTKVQTPEQLMAERKTPPHPTDAKGAAGSIDPAVAAGIVRELFDQHYRRCLDEPIPALDGKTPRQCIRSKKGREQIIEWLKYLENHELHRAAKEGSEPYDFGWMWEELKLAKPQR
jgi:hypothetical protein